MSEFSVYLMAMLIVLVIMGIVLLQYKGILRGEFMKLALVVLLVNLISCSSVKHSSNPGRSVSNIDSLDPVPAGKQLAEFLRSDIELYNEFVGSQDFKILRTPIADPSAISNIMKFRDAILPMSENMGAFLELIVPTLDRERPVTGRAYTDEELRGIELKNRQMDLLVKTYHGELEKELIKNLTLEERIKLVEITSSVDSRPKRYLNPASVFGYAKWLMRQTQIFILERKDLHRALVDFPADPSKSVKYVGDEAEMVYASKNLRQMVNVIAYFLANNKSVFKEVFFDLPNSVKSKFTKNSYANTSKAKVEPFDLILHQLTISFLSLNINKIGGGDLYIDFMPLKRSYKKALVQALGMSNEDDIYAWKTPAVSAIKNENSFVFLCANGIHETSKRYNSSSYGIYDENRLLHEFNNETGQKNILEVWEPFYNIDKLTGADVSGSNFRCGTAHYKIKYEPVMKEPISAPEELNFKGEVNVLMTLALTHEIDRKNRYLIKKYLSTFKGWDVVQDFRQVDTKEQFDILFKSAHVYFPVSHDMDVNYFLVGTEKSNYLILRKEIKTPSGPKIVNMHVLVPEKGDEYTAGALYSVDELGKLYAERRKSKLGPLFLMNLSCGSAGTLMTWTQVFRESVKHDASQKLSEYKDLPYILGANRSFGTETIGDISQNINYPLKTIEILIKENDVAPVIEFLKSPPDSRFLKSVGYVFGSASSEGDSDSQDDGFDPVFNLDKPELLRFGGFSIELTNKRSGEVQFYQ